MMYMMYNQEIARTNLLQLASFLWSIFLSFAITTFSTRKLMKGMFKVQYKV